MLRFAARRFASTFSPRYTTKNEPILDYRRDSAELKGVQAALNDYQSKVTRIPCIVDGKEVWTRDLQKQVLPFDHQHVLAEYCYADRSLLQQAIDSAVKNQFKWNQMPIEERANIFLKVKKGGGRGRVLVRRSTELFRQRTSLLIRNGVRD